MTHRIPAGVDLETEPIDPRRPHRPPRPVGVALRLPGRKARYYAWGHDSGNNDPEGRGVAELRRLWDLDLPVLFHNAAFDLSVAEAHLGLPWLPPERVEDTLPLLWLANPYLPLGLKDAAERFCGVEHAPRDELQDWIRKHVPAMKGRRKGWGAHIARAPGALVAPYARQDAEDPLRLWRELRSVREAMPRAYRREIAVLEPVWRMTQRGIPLDVPGLARFLRDGEAQLERMARGLARSLGVPAAELGRAGVVADALERRGWVDPKAWVRTGKTGARSVAADALDVCCTHPAFVSRWRTYLLLQHMLSTFVRPWLDLQDGGRLHVRWNTVLAGPDPETGRLRKRGAKTGRLSSEPNVQNISKDDPPGGLPSLREFVRAARGMGLVCGDESQQEPRIMAHFAGGEEAEAYRRNPHLDAHGHTSARMSHVAHRVVPRVEGKVLNLAIPYALGVDKLALRLGTIPAEARRARQEWWASKPDVRRLDQDLRKHWALSGVIETWGGALVRCEAETVDADGEVLRSYEYRALNTLIQRSAAEQLKECIIAAEPAGLDLVLTAHDELLGESPWGERKRRAGLMREVLEDVGGAGFDVPFVAEVGHGKTWRKAKP